MTARKMIESTIKIIFDLFMGALKLIFEDIKYNSQNANLFIHSTKNWDRCLQRQITQILMINRDRIEPLLGVHLHKKG